VRAAREEFAIIGVPARTVPQDEEEWCDESSKQLRRYDSLGSFDKLARKGLQADEEENEPSSERAGVGDVIRTDWFFC
jgi:hypothetical protein